MQPVQVADYLIVLITEPHGHSWVRINFRQQPAPQYVLILLMTILFTCLPAIPIIMVPISAYIKQPMPVPHGCRPMEVLVHVWRLKC